jgi:long-subunit acyl-CoA synthetase (AMP-forming)
MFDRLVCSKIREKVGLDRCEFATSAAAPISSEVLEFLWALGVKIHEAYGLTECSAPSNLNPRHQIRIGTVGPALPGAEIQRAVEAANRQVSRVEWIKRFGILPAEWTVDSAELTPTLKLKRRVIQHKYAKELEALYG